MQTLFPDSVILRLAVQSILNEQGLGINIQSNASFTINYLKICTDFVFRKYADICPLLDVEDMVRMKKPDWKCVFTYVQSFYKNLKDHANNRTMPK